jgi:hypothetical protein
VTTGVRLPPRSPLSTARSTRAASRAERAQHPARMRAIPRRLEREGARTSRTFCINLPPADALPLLRKPGATDPPSLRGFLIDLHLRRRAQQIIRPESEYAKRTGRRAGKARSRSRGPFAELNERRSIIQLFDDCADLAEDGLALRQIAQKRDGGGPRPFSAIWVESAIRTTTAITCNPSSLGRNRARYPCFSQKFSLWIVRYFLKGVLKFVFR